MFLPELTACIGVKQDPRFHKWDVYKHCVYTVDNSSPDLVLRLAGLLHDIGKAEVRAEKRSGDGVGPRITFHKHEMVSVKLAEKALSRLRYDKVTKDEVLKLVKYHMYHYLGNVYKCSNPKCSWKKAEMKTESVPNKCPVCEEKLTFMNGWTDSAIRRFITNVGITEKDLDNLDEFPLFKLRSAERRGNGFKLQPVTDKQKDFQNRIIDVFKASTGLTIKDLEIDGNVLMNTFKLKPSPKIGEVLNYLLDIVLENPELNNRLDLLKQATEYFYNKKFI